MLVGLSGLVGPAGLNQRDVDTSLCEAFRGPPARRARSDDDDVIGQTLLRHGCAILCPVSDPGNTIRRRDLLTGLAAGVAGAMAVPDLSAHTPDMSQAAPRQAPTAAPALPTLLDSHRRAMLVSVADQIVPGARAA